MSKHRKPIKNDGRKEDIKLKKILLTTAKLTLAKTVFELSKELFETVKEIIEKLS